MDVEKGPLFPIYSKLLAPTPPTRLCRATSPLRGGLGFFDSLRKDSPGGESFLCSGHDRKLTEQRCTDAQPVQIGGTLIDIQQFHD